MDSPGRTFLPVAPLAELQRQGVVVVRGADRPIAVFVHDGRVSAVDNRCPHLGFPLHRGSVRDGLLTCHWHHARFDLCSGCTFDLWADDVPAYDVAVRDGEVYVAALPRQANRREQYRRRLREGMEQVISLIRVVPGQRRSARYRPGAGAGGRPRRQPRYACATRLGTTIRQASTTISPSSPSSSTGRRARHQW